MPYMKVWQEPELVLEHAGVKVYATYKNEDDEERMTRSFTTDPREESGGLESPYAFPLHHLQVPHHGTVVDVLRRAIDAGLVKVPDDLVSAHAADVPETTIMYHPV